jgi:hypothetical protein
MKTKLILTAVALILSLPAVAAFTFIVNSYELSLDEVRLPRNEGGTIGYKPCEECDYRTNYVATDIRWQINGRAVTFEEFTEQAELLSGSDHTVTVTQDIKSKQIAKVAMVISDYE